jgi:hypothetical protein
MPSNGQYRKYLFTWHTFKTCNLLLSKLTRGVTWNLLQTTHVLHPSAPNLRTQSYFTLEELRAAFSYTYSNAVQETVKCSGTYHCQSTTSEFWSLYRLSCTAVDCCSKVGPALVECQDRYLPYKIAFVWLTDWLNESHQNFHGYLRAMFTRFPLNKWKSELQ